MCGLIAQLVQYRTGVEEVTGSYPVEALIFSGFFFPIFEIGKFTAMITLHFQSSNRRNLKIPALRSSVDGSFRNLFENDSIM